MTPSTMLSAKKQQRKTSFPDPDPRQGRLYARFSPRPHSAECESVNHQFEDMRKWCAEHGYTIVGEHRDEAESGGKRDREGLEDALFALKRGETLVVRSIDRLARDSLFYNIIVDDLKSRGCKIVSITEDHLNRDTIEADLVGRILMAVAEYLKGLTAARTRAAMRAHQRNGLSMGGQPPYGWKKVKTDKINPNTGKPVYRLEPDADEQRNRVIVQRLASEGRTVMEIATALTTMGAKTRKGDILWQRNQVVRIIQQMKDEIKNPPPVTGPVRGSLRFLPS